MAVLAIVYALEKMYDENLFPSLIIIGKNGEIITFLCIALFLIGIIPIYFPSILYGYPQQAKPVQNTKIEEQPEDLQFGLDQQEVNSRLEELRESKSYLNKSFNLTQCVRETGNAFSSYFLFSKKLLWVELFFLQE